MHIEILERQVVTGNRVIGIIRPSSCGIKGKESEENVSMKRCLERRDRFQI